MATLAEAKDKVRELSKKALATVEDPALSTAEKKTALDLIEPDIKKWEEEVQDLERFAETRKRFASGLSDPDEAASITGKDAVDGDPAGAGGEKPWRAKSLGEQFTQHALYKQLVGDGGIATKGGKWTSGSIELKTALTEGTSGTPGPGFAFVQTPVVLPGLTQVLFQPTTFLDLLPQGSTDSPLLRYLVESAITNAAATVAELGLKPESAITFSKVDEVLHKIATFLPVSDEMLEDHSQIQSYLNARLMLFVRLQAEVQHLRGDGTGNNIVGLLNRTGLAPNVVAKTDSPPGGSAVAPYLSPSATDNDMDAIYRQITQVRVTSFLEPEAIVIDPAAWMLIQLTKSSQGIYYAGGPFMGVGQQPHLWGKGVTVTTSMPANTALVGAFSQACQRFVKGGITVEASNSHADFFQRNETAIRAETRELLAVYRPGAFGTVTNLV